MLPRIQGRPLLALALPGVLALGSCSSTPAPPAFVVEAGCQPLFGPTGSATEECVAPYPSDFFRLAQAGPRGERIAHAPAGRLLTSRGAEVDLTSNYPSDGFSTLPLIVGALPGELARVGLPNLLDAAPSGTQATSPTLLIDAESGERIDHYTDVGISAREPALTPLLLHPRGRLRENRRYVVVVQAVRLAQGELARRPEGFDRLLTGAFDAAASPVLAAERVRYAAQIFPVLERAAIAREQVQLAWDFTTGSDAESTRDLLGIRARTLSWLATNTPQLTVVSAVDGEGGYQRVIRGTLTAPRFVTSDAPGARLSRDTAGALTENGESTFAFSAAIPKSLATSFDGGVATLHGHGFFGTHQASLLDPSTRQLAGDAKLVYFSTDWIGMSDGDLPQVVTDLREQPSVAARFTERVHQAMANMLVLSAAAGSVLPRAAEFRRPQSGEGVVVVGGASNAGESWVSAAPQAYVGGSLGQILGTVQVALNPNIARTYVHVGGAGWMQMVPRAAPFAAFDITLGVTFRDSLRSQLYLAQLARPIERIDPFHYLPLIRQAPLPSTVAGRQVLMQFGVGDALVPNVGSIAAAQLMGLRMTGPSRDVSELPFPATLPASAPASGVTVWDFGIGREVYRLPQPPPLNAVHGGVHDELAAREQAAVFLRTGRIEHACAGECKSANRR